MKTVIWKTTNTVPTSCPDYVPDVYTGQYPAIHCSVYHCKEITEEKTATFESEERAQEFIKNAPSNCFDFVIL